MIASVTSAPNLQECVGAFLEKLEQRSIQYCALHAHAGWLYEFDFAVADEDVENILEIARQCDSVKLVQAISRSGRTGLILEYLEADRPKLVRVELVAGEWSSAGPTIHPTALVASRRRVDEMWVPSAESQLRHLLVESCFQPLASEARQHLRALAGELGSERANDVARDVFGLDGCVIDLLLRQEGADLQPDLRRRLMSRHFAAGLKWRGQSWSRSLGTWLRPDGLFCVLLGPDGVGKSTSVEQLRSELEAVFGRCHTQRWRPAAIRKIAPSLPNKMPHAKTLRGGLPSVIYMFGLATDFVVGYFTHIRPALARSEAIIFDRYFHDMLIDSRRYRYSGPAWLIKALAPLVPPHNALFVILDADEEVILARKQELPLEELRRQRLAYRRFGARQRNCVSIDTGNSVRETAALITAGLFRFLAAKHGFTKAVPAATGTPDDPSEGSPVLGFDDFEKSAMSAAPVGLVNPTTHAGVKHQLELL